MKATTPPEFTMPPQGDATDAKWNLKKLVDK
jgi:hypothetical protein